MYDDSDCPPENDGYEVPNKPDWNQKNQTPLPSTSSKPMSDSEVKNETNGGISGSFKNANDDLTTVNHVGKDSSGFTEKQILEKSV